MWVKNLIYAVLSQFQICHNLRIFFLQICIPQISDFTEFFFFKSGQNSKTQIVTELKNSNSDKTQKLKLWENWKT